MEVLNDRSVVANANLKADMERWHKTKQRDVKDILIALADRQIRYYEKVGVVFGEATVVYTSSLSTFADVTSAYLQL